MYKTALLALGVALVLLVPIVPEPYYHRRRVPLLLWLTREIEEAYTGERS